MPQQATEQQTTPTHAISSLEDLRSYLEEAQHHFHGHLGQYLLKHGLITEDKLEAALAQKSAQPQRRLGEILTDMQAIKKEDLQAALNTLMGIPFIRLSQFDLEHSAIKQISPELAHKHHVVPITMFMDGLVIACSSIPDNQALQEISFNAGVHLHPVLASLEDIQAAIFLHYDTFADDVAEAETIIKYSNDEEEQRTWREAEYLAKQAPIVRLVNSFIYDGIRRHASDIHIRPAEGYFDVLYRIDGTLVPIKRLQSKLLPPVVSRIKILSTLNIAERRVPQDGHMQASFMGRHIDLRISIIPTSHGESVVVRILNKQYGLRTISEIGFSADDEQKFRDLISRSNGMLLVTGPTGSGKTTTLYAALQEIRKEQVNIITVEDPIEYELEGMTQIHLLEQAGFTFPKTLRHILRHDPDVIMIGEVRDSETCKIALESALTGHLVLSTLHTTDAPSALIRLEEMGMSPYLIKSAVIGVLGQRLIRLNCPHCLEEEDIPEIVRKNLNLSADEKFYKGKGCDKCDDTGFQGRAAIYEMFIVNEAVQDALHEGMTGNELRDLAIANGMRPLIGHGLEYARAQKASLREVYRASM